MAVNVAGPDDQMFAGTLFVHLKGSFTGADQKHEGLLAQALKLSEGNQGGALCISRQGLNKKLKRSKD